MSGGKVKLVLVSTSSPKAKRVISKKPPMLKKSEIELLRADLKNSFEAFAKYDKALLEA